MNDIDRDSRGGPVNSDVSYFRDTDAVIRYPVIQGVSCHQCGSGEVYQPMQTADMPMIYRCLWCGEVAPTRDFDRCVDPRADREEIEAP